MPPTKLVCCSFGPTPTTFSTALYVFLEEADYSEQRSFGYSATVLGLLGLMLGLTLYNLFIFVVTRDINYLWYSLFAVTLTACWASYYGLLWSTVLAYTTAPAM